MRWYQNVGALACCAAIGVGGAVFAVEPEPRVTQDRPANQAATQDPAPNTVTEEQIRDEDILVAKTFRASKLTGLNVRNLQGETLGTIDDFVVDVRTGKVQYVAMSVGGVLGIGDRLFAVPFSELKFNHGQDEMFFVMNMAKDKIASAPGFDKNDWPNFADPNWKERIDKHYRQTETRTGAEDPAPRTDGTRVDD